MSSQFSKQLLHFLGGGLGAAGIVFVAVRLHEDAGEIDFTQFGPLEWGGLLTLAIIYGAANTFLARAWWWQLGLFNLHTEWRWALRAYGLSQLAKYIPGNVFHFAGRQALGMAAGLAAVPLMKSAVWEVGSIVVAGACFSFLTLPLVYPPFNFPAAISTFSFSIASIYFLSSRLIAREAALGFLWQVAFLTISGLVFVGALLVTGSHTELATFIPMLSGAFVVAWLIGLLVPGAPAGVGIRETALLFLLASHINSGSLLLAVIISRLITVAGDFLFFGIMFARKA